MNEWNKINFEVRNTKSIRLFKEMIVTVKKKTVHFAITQLGPKNRVNILLRVVIHQINIIP